MPSREETPPNLDPGGLEAGVPGLRDVLLTNPYLARPPFAPNTSARLAYRDNQKDLSCARC